jgi:uncharacterized integral membrane protein
MRTRVFEYHNYKIKYTNCIDNWHNWIGGKMSEQQPPSNPPGNNPENQPPVPPPPYSDWREQRRSEREAFRSQSAAWRAQRRAAGYPGGAWIGGVILVILGLIFLVQNVSGLQLANWWALFILIPAFGALWGAWNAYQANGRFSAGARSSAIFGIALILLAAAFLFNVSLSLYWPLALILVGILLLVNALLPV